MCVWEGREGGCVAVYVRVYVCTCTCVCVCVFRVIKIIITILSKSNYFFSRIIRVDIFVVYYVVLSCLKY